MKSLASDMLGKASSMIQKTTNKVLGTDTLSPTKILSTTSPLDGAGAAEANDDPNKMSEDEEKRIMRMIEQEDSSDEDQLSEDEKSSGQGDAIKKGKGGNNSDNDSFCSDNDIFNRSL